MPKTIARCSLVSTVLVYRWRNISVPETVGMRARTTHCTSGRVSSRRGRLFPQPPEGVVLSTGTPRGPAVVVGV